MTSRGVLLDAALVAVLGELEHDEARVLVFLAQRLLEGRRRYGALDLANDPRDWRREQAEECADLLAYGAFAAVKRELQRECAEIRKPGVNREPIKTP